MELEATYQEQTLIDQVEDKLDQLGNADARVQQLWTILGVGARLAEVIVAVIDDAKRFKNAKQVENLAIVSVLGRKPLQTKRLK
ncbi:MAG TPA: transposase [Pirellulales bacterium]|jgi:hypothetical protein